MTVMSASEYLPPRKSFIALKHAASRCKGCELYKNATQTVFGAGNAIPLVLFVGEQPGDKEDLAGKPFVGPSGKLLERALVDAKLNTIPHYITNAVKHFKFQRVGKRRLHQKPRDGEIDACRPWLESEIEVLRPNLIVCLGSSAARSIFRRQVRVTKERGRFLTTEWEIPALVTVHPSAILRSGDGKARAESYAEFVRELRKISPKLSKLKPPSKNEAI
jgi:uracil-DNA glycosylase